MSQEDIGTELRGWLIQQADLTVMLDKDGSAPRIHPSVLPQSAGQEGKAIVYHLISDVSEGTAGLRTTVSHAILQFDCYGPTPLLANRIRTKLKQLLDNKQRGTIGNLFACAIIHEGDRDETDTAVDGSDDHRFIRQCDYRISYQLPTS